MTSKELGVRGQEWDPEVRKPLSLYSERFLHVNHRIYVWIYLIMQPKFMFLNIG